MQIEGKCWKWDEEEKILRDNEERVMESRGKRRSFRKKYEIMEGARRRKEEREIKREERKMERKGKEMGKKENLEELEREKEGI